MEATNPVENLASIYYSMFFQLCLVGETMYRPIGEYKGEAPKDAASGSSLEGGDAAE